MNIREYTDADETHLIELWQRCNLTRPWNNPQLDIKRKLDAHPNWLLVGLIDDALVSSIMVGYDGHRGWINYLAVAPEQRRKGIGRALMAEAESRLRGVGCPKINLQMRLDNVEAIGFYESIGFGQDNVVSLGKRLIVDT